METDTHDNTDKGMLTGIKEIRDYNANHTLKDPDPDEIKDGYQLRWVGKSFARLVEGLKPKTVIVPDRNHNERSENQASQNLFLTGDNLEVLKHLQHAYARQVDVIYIDPPYNTGSDQFEYQDNFRFTDEYLRDRLGLTDQEVSRIRSLYGKASHSAWLTFMYPRLKVAKRLLTDTGVIFVSIDDNEQANLKLLMNEIFGEGNSIANFIVVRSEGGGLAKQAVIGHDYVMAYSRDLSKMRPLGRPKDIRGKVVEIDGEEYWIETDWLRVEFGQYGTLEYEDIQEVKGEAKKKEIDQGIQDGKYVLIKRDTGRHIVGRYRKVAEDTSKFYTILKHLNADGVENLEQLGLDEFFSFPKPVSLIKELVLGATIMNKNALVLDFFAGSATTAQAVMELNKEDSGHRRYILCNLNEPIKSNPRAKEAGYKTIDEVSRKRIELAAAAIEDVSGFRHYRFVEPAEKTIERIESFNPNQLSLISDDMVQPFSEKALTGTGSDDGVATILTTWLLGDGYDFGTKAETIRLGNYTAHYAPEIARLYLIDNRGWTSTSCRALLNLLGENRIAINTLVVYPYSFSFTDLTELKHNLRSALDNPPQILERY